MIKIFKKINKYTRVSINIIVRIILTAIYFVVFFPFCIFIRLFSDFLNTKGYNFPNWIPRSKIKDVDRFLRLQ
ncbi:MAG: hypothetical protein ISS47_05105 [Candidatus Omnitrophica bacterium]|nr:hypothetical protein [Candidatus Omnitrophota bacterium]